MPPSYQPELLTASPTNTTWCKASKNKGNLTTVISKNKKINIQVDYVPSEEDLCHEYRNAIKPSQSTGTSSTRTILSSQTAITKLHVFK
jgi:hypothetical protein